MAWRRKLLVSLLVAVIGVGTTAGTAAAAQKTAPPHSRAFGHTLSEWMVLYFEWSFTGVVDPAAKGATFLPVPAGEWQGDGSFTAADPSTLVGSTEVTLKPGTPFVLPVVAWYGESYNTGQQDDAELSESIFTKSNALVRVDGKAVIDSQRDNLARWYVPPAYFDPPIVYPEPTSYGSISANFVQGLNLVHGPLSRGDHVLTLESEFIALVPNYYGPGNDLNVGVKYRNTWTIHVTR